MALEILEMGDLESKELESRFDETQTDEIGSAPFSRKTLNILEFSFEHLFVFLVRLKIGVCSCVSQRRESGEGDRLVGGPSKA